MQNLPGLISGIRDPLGAVLQLLTGVLGHFIDTARGDLNSELSRYLFTTVDPTAPGTRALTANPTVGRLNLVLALAADALIAVVLLYSSLRSMFEHSLHARYALKVVLPRVLAALALVHGSMFFMQMGINLNNALGGVALGAGGSLTPDTLPWSGSMSPGSAVAIQASQDLFRAVFALGVVVAVVILVLSYVIRTALLDVLIVVAPLAALCSVLPETRRYATTWLRLFLTAVFMQAIQLLVLRVAVSVGFAGAGIAESLYAIATLWILLKVPGTMHAATHVESRAHTAARHVQRSVHHALVPAHHAARPRATS